jgi:hypothetical protein
VITHSRRRGDLGSDGCVPCFTAARLRTYLFPHDKGGFRHGGRNGGSGSAIAWEEAGVLRALAIGLAIAVIVFALTAGHVIFLPLLFIPFGLFSLGHRQNRRRRGWW